MLQQILSDMFVDPELLAQLDDEQKQILFCKMREEQVRRWIEHEKAFELELKSRKFVPSDKNQKSVQFLLGLDGQPWTWIMGEHKNDKNIDQIMEEETRNKAMMIAEKETDQLLSEKSEELDDKLTEALLIENNNNVTKVPPDIKPEPIADAISPRNKVFQNIKLFENSSTPERVKPPLTINKTANALKEVNSPSVTTNISQNKSSTPKTELSNKLPNSNVKNNVSTSVKEVRPNTVINNDSFKTSAPDIFYNPAGIPLLNSKIDVSKDTASKYAESKSPRSMSFTNTKTNVSTNNDQKRSPLRRQERTMSSPLDFENEIVNGVGKLESKDKQNVPLNASNSSNDVLSKPPIGSQSSNVKPLVTEPVKYRAPKPPVPSEKASNTIEPSPIKLDDKEVLRIIQMTESPLLSPEKPKLRPKPSTDKDSWLLQQKEKVKERLKEQRSTEIYQQITEGRKRISQIAEEINKEQEEIWKEQERKAKEAEKQIRDLARKARELHRRSSQMEENDKPEVKPKPSQTTSRSRDARLYTKAQIIQWFNEEEIPKNVILDPKTGEIAIWFHGIINRDQSEHLLQDSPTGSFLVRLNDRIKGYVISYKTSDRCKHYLIDASSGNYQFFGANQTVHTSLYDLIGFHKTKPISSPGQEYLTLPCPQPSGTPNYASLLT